MGKKLNDDILKFIVDIDGKPAQQGLNLVEKETRKLEKSNRELVKEMAKLEAHGKKGSDEWKKYEAQIKQNNTSISGLKKKQEALRKEVGISNLTVKQLKQEYRRLKQAQDGADPNSKEWKQYSGQLKAVKNRLTQLNGAQKRTNSLFGSLKTLMPAMGIAAGVALFSRLIDKIFDTRSEFEKYEAVLTTTFGSQKKARKEMDMLVEFAAKTPFQLNELTGSFVKLTNYGIQPTRKEMTKMGDLASSVGKGFDQLAEAVADAITGENERLKEFGIRAQKHGDKIKYTFKGITTEVDNNAKAIKKYIYGLGAMEGVAGSMTAISATMGGQASNMADNFDRMWNNLGKGTAGGIITSAIGGMNSLLDVTNSWLEASAEEKLELEGELVRRLVIQLSDSNIENSTRVRLLNELKDINPDIVEGIDAENISFEKLSGNVKEYNDQLVKKIVLSRLDEEEQKILSAAAEKGAKAKRNELDILERIYDANLDIAASDDDFITKLEKIKAYLIEQGASYEEIAKKSAVSVDRHGVINDYRSKEQKWLDEIVALEGGRINLLNRQKEIEEDLDPIQARIREAKKLLKVEEDITTEIDKDPDSDNKTPKPKKLLTIKEIEIQNNEDLNEEDDEWRDYDPSKDPTMQMYAKRDAAELELRDQKRALKKAEGEADAADREKKNKDELGAAAKHNKKLLKEEQKLQNEKKQLKEAAFAFANSMLTLMAASIESQMQKELADAGDNEREKDEIKREYAKKQRDIAIKQAWVNSGQAIIGTWAGYAEFSWAGTVAAALQTAAILAETIAQTKMMKSQEFSEGNVIDIIGKNTGEKYRTTISDGRSGIYSKPTYVPGLNGIVGEKDPELVLSGAHTRNIQNNYPEIMNAIAYTMPEYANGNMSSTVTERTFEKTFTDPELIKTMNKFSEAVNRFDKNGMPFVWTKFKEKQDEYDQLTKSIEIR